MKQYIPKSTLVAEIEKLQLYTMDEHMNFYSAEAQGEYNALSKLESFLNTLEVKDVDEIIKNAEDHAYFAGSENASEKLIDKACDAYCKVCGHYAHSVPTHICRHDCRYFSDFQKAMKAE